MKNGMIIGFTMILLSISAQVNTEKFRAPEEFEGLSGYLELKGTIKTGNAEKTEAGVDGRLNWKTKSSTTFFVFESDYEWVDNKRSSDEGLFHIRYIHELVDSFEVEAYGQINYDKKLLITNRELVGAGLRYKLFDFDKSDVSIGTGFMFEHENYDVSENSFHPSEVKISRWSNYISFYFQLNQSVTLGGVIYYQPMFSNFSDYRLLNESSLIVGLSKLFSLTVNFKIRHDYLPPDGIEQTDTETNLGIAVKF